MRKEYNTLWIRPEVTKFIIVYQSERGQYAFFIGVADTCERAEELICEDMKNVNTERKEYAIIPCVMNSIRPTAIDRLVELQNSDKYEDIFDVFDEGVI